MGRGRKRRTWRISCKKNTAIAIVHLNFEEGLGQVVRNESEALFQDKANM